MFALSNGELKMENGKLLEQNAAHFELDSGRRPQF